MRRQLAPALRVTVVLLVLTCGPRDNVLRLIPPLTIADDELEHGLGILTAALAEVR